MEHVYLEIVVFVHQLQGGLELHVKFPNVLQDVGLGLVLRHKSATALELNSMALYVTILFALFLVPMEYAVLLIRVIAPQQTVLGLDNTVKPPSVIHRVIIWGSAMIFLSAIAQRR